MDTIYQLDSFQSTISWDVYIIHVQDRKMFTGVIKFSFTSEPVYIKRDEAEEEEEEEETQKKMKHKKQNHIIKKNSILNKSESEEKRK